MPTLLAAAAIVLVVLLLWRLRAAQARPARGRTDEPRRAAERFGRLDFEPRVTEAFRALLDSPKGGFLVVSSGNYYVQATWDTAMPELQVEAVSNEFLSAKAQLDGEREQALLALGFEAPGKDENFSRTFERADAEPARLARLAADAFSRAFRVPPEGSFEIQLELD